MSVAEHTAGPHILVVEDNEDISALFGYTLGAAGYAVTCVSTKREATRILQEKPVSLVVTDWNLPDGTATDICEIARRQSDSVPIVLISGQANVQTMHVSACHIDAWLSKPVMPDKLLSTVKQLLE